MSFWKSIRIVDTNNRVAAVDSMTNTIQTIDYAHHEVHEGDSFVGGYAMATAVAAALIVAWKTPAGTKRIHVVPEWITESKAHVSFLEGCTWNTGTGSALTPINRNRGSANESIVLGDSTGAFVANKMVKDPTGLAGGTAIGANYTWSEKKVGSSARSVAEFVLKPDTLYAFSHTSDDGNKGAIIRLSWYEHTDSN